MNLRQQYIILALTVVALTTIAGTDTLTKKHAAYAPRHTPPPASEITHGDTSKQQVIFTFDGGEGIQSAEKILAVLATHHVRGTFFLTGKTIAQYPELTARIAAAGHEIFNHTYHHPHLSALSPEKIRDELSTTEQALWNTARTSSQPYFRAPYGDRNTAVLAAAHAAGYRSVYWTVDALDWRESAGETATQVKERILSHVAPGTIYLMHIGDTITGSILDDVFSEIEARGYRIVSLTQGL